MSDAQASLAAASAKADTEAKALNANLAKRVAQDLQASLNSSLIYLLVRHVAAQDPTFDREMTNLVGSWKTRTMADVRLQAQLLQDIEGVSDEVMAGVIEQHVRVHQKLVDSIASTTLKLTSASVPHPETPKPQG